MKHQHNFQIQAMICFAALLLCACAAEETTGPRETTQGNTLPTVEKAYTLPETDWEGRTFSLFGVADFGSSMFAAEEIGEPVNDAKFDMMRTVEEALNITLEETLYSPCTDANAHIGNLVTAGDTTYDGIATRDSELISLMQSGYLRPLEEIETIRTDEIWWGADQATAYSVAGHNYMLIAKFHSSTIRDGACILMNTALAENYGLEVPYADVFAGTWTMDDLFAYRGVGSRDLNGDGEMTTDDAYTFVQFGPCAIWRQMWTGCGMDIIEKDEEGIPHVTVYDNEPFFNTLQRTYDLLYTGIDSTRPFLDANYLPLPDDVNDLNFEAGNSLFYLGTLRGLNTFRSMEDDYAVLPFPKYDEAQEKYYSHIMDAIGYCIPNSADDDTALFGGAVFDAIACVSYYDFVPVYVDTVLKDKLAREEDTKACIQLCIDGLKSDVGANYLTDFFRYPIYDNIHKKGVGNMASYFESISKRINKTLEKISEKMIDLS